MILCGIDYSMTCPALCIIDTSCPMEFTHCSCHYLTPQKSLGGKTIAGGRIEGTHFDKSEYEGDDIKRFDAISTWAFDVMAAHGVEFAAIEGYAMAGKGRVFNIAENTALLKFKLLRGEIPYAVYPPKVIKMFAINNSRLDFTHINKNKIQKDEMNEIFIDETGVNLKEILTPKKSKVDSPVSDIIDSYNICRKLRDDIQNGEIKIR